MVRQVSHEEIAGAAQDDIQIVEVLGASEYERIHIRGAINIPLEMLDRDTTERLDPGRPVAVYCFDAY